MNTPVVGGGAMRRGASALWSGVAGRRRGIATRLYVVAGLLLAALALQAAGALRVAHELKSTTDRLVQDSLGAATRVAQIQDTVLRHQRLIESAVERRQDPAPWLASHRDGIARLHDMLREEATMQGTPADSAPTGSAPTGRAADAMRQRAVRDLMVLDLTGAAVLNNALAAGAPDGSEALQRSLRVFGVSAARFLEDMQRWREDRWEQAEAEATGLRERMAQVARRAVLAALATVSLGLFGLVLLRRIMGQLGGITEAVLRVARHEPDITIPARDDPGPVGDVARAVSALAEDVRELERRGIAQARTSQLLDTALNSMAQGLVTTGPDGGLTLWNRRFAAILALRDGTIRIGVTMPRLLTGLCAPTDLATLAPPSGSAVQEQRGVASLGQEAGGRATVVRTHWIRMPDGGWLGTFEDITQLRRNEARLIHLTRHDGLTDLPNRGAMREAVARALGQARHDAPFAVLSVTLNRLGTVNQALGQEAGDTLIRAAAERLRGQVRDTDTIGRTGANTFMVVQSDVVQPSGAQAMAERLLEVLSEPYDLPDGIVVVGASIGIALAEAGEADADRLIRNAELARQRARKEGGGVAHFFAPEMNAHAQDRRLLELDLHQALERGEFELFYQPLISVRDRRVCAFEALLRWHHPRRGLVRPDLFIPVAEELGLIGQIGEWVLHRACAEAATWPADVSVAVNLSPLQFARDALVDQVDAALAAASLAPTRLELEITESVLLRDSAGTLAMLHRLRALGVRIALDDFGTGYSSLSYLRSFPFDKIKIDKSFVKDIESRPESRAIAVATLNLAKSLGMRCTAEGVETLYQADFLRDNGCDELQGFFISRAQPLDNLGHVVDVRPAGASPRPAIAMPEVPNDANVVLFTGEKRA